MALAFAMQLGLGQSIVRHLSYGDLDLQQAESYLLGVGIGEAHQAAVLKLWRTNKAKVHDAITKDMLWGNRLQSFNWRLDVKTKSKHLSDLNDTAAVIEMDLKIPNEKQTQVVRFEMDRAMVNETVRQIALIEARLGSV